MHGEAIEAVRNGLQVMLSALMQDPYALETAYLSVIAFDSSARQLTPLTELTSFQLPNLQANGMTAMGEALSLLADCIQGARAALPSVYLPNEPIFAAAARENMASVDESLGLLFSYIEEHYGEDEYIIQLYSDHGSAVLVDEPQYLMGAAQTGAAWMLRGAGVPQLGVVDELTSALDIYPTAARLAGFTAPAHIDGNLPAALGGAVRDHVISNSIFPGQTYKLCIRTREHEFRLESQEVVDEDGSVDLRQPKMQLFRRADMTREIEDRERLAHFLAIARAHTASFDTRGEIWQEKRALRKSWFG